MFLLFYSESVMIFCDTAKSEVHMVIFTSLSNHASIFEITIKQNLPVSHSNGREKNDDKKNKIKNPAVSEKLCIFGICDVIPQDLFFLHKPYQAKRTEKAVELICIFHFIRTYKL